MNNNGNKFSIIDGINLGIGFFIGNLMMTIILSGIILFIIKTFFIK